MSVRKTTTICCDVTGCRNEFVHDGGTIYLARTAASKDGWNISHSGDWCLDHRTRASRMRITAPGVTE